MAGGTGVITYTERTDETEIETMLKASVDNIIHLDSETMAGLKHVGASCQITDNGILVEYVSTGEVISSYSGCHVFVVQVSYMSLDRILPLN